MTTNLLNLNVDTLFEQHSVPEIDIIQRKIQAVVENKREELRTMVGERYRDLLQAADTIVSMQTSGAKLITQVEEITENCREQQIMGLKTHDTAELLRQRNASKELNTYFSTMVQIKLLTSLPEMIWSKIDQEHFYAATELFIFSRHISTGLQLDASNELMKHLPVAKKQWEILKPFHTTIKQNVLTVLERENLTAEVAVVCLLSLLLLEKSSFNGAIKTFLQLRCAAFSTCLSYSQSASDTDVEVRRVKERILASLRILNGTMTLLNKFLLKNDLLIAKLSAHSDVPPTISLTDEAQHANLLPEIISNFRPKHDLQALDEKVVAASIEQWLADTKRIASVQLKQLFSLVAHMTSIQDIKMQANEYKKELELAEVEVHFNLKDSLDFFETYYMPLINQRVRDIINENWSLAILATFHDVEQSFADEALLEQNIWQEQPSDLPASLELALSDDRKLKFLLMRTKGYDSSILKICDTFDTKLSAIIAEMNVLLQEKIAKPADKLALVEFLRDIAKQHLIEFLEKLKNLSAGKEQRKQLLFIVRVCVALIELCPHLKICFCQQLSWRQWIGGSGQHTAASLDHWQSMCLLFEEEVQCFWSTILDGVLTDHNCQLLMPNKLSHDVLLEDFVLWETITLEQKDELNDTIHSSSRIPNQPRISLQTYLFNLIHILNLSVPQTLPSKVLTALNQKLLTQLLAHYETLSKLPTLPTNQSIALQLYFDLKFLQTCFNVSRENRALTDQFQKLQTTFKDIVDPFDFELFAEHIAENVKRAVKRLACELGVLLPVDSQMGGSITVAASLTHEKDPNVLSLSTCASSAVWFSLLPIVKGTSSKGRIAGTETEKQQTTTAAPSVSTTPTRKSRKGNNDPPQKPKSGATSFFGAMSQEWFR